MTPTPLAFGLKVLLVCSIAQVPSGKAVVPLYGRPAFEIDSLTARIHRQLECSKPITLVMDFLIPCALFPVLGGQKILESIDRPVYSNS